MSRGSAGGTDSDSGDSIGISKSMQRRAGTEGDADDPKDETGSTETTGDDSVVQGETAEDAVAEEDIVQPVRVRPADFSQAVRQVSQLLTAASQAETIWQLVQDPETEISKLKEFAVSLATKGAEANTAYSAVKALAQRLPMKGLVTARESSRQQDRKLAIELQTFMNSVDNNKMTITTADRQMVPLPKILDALGANFLRLENLRVNYAFSRDKPEAYTAEAVTTYREKALQPLVGLIDAELVGEERRRADAETLRMLEIHQAEQFVGLLLAECRGFVENLAEEGKTKSLQDLLTALGEQPLEITLATPEGHVLLDGEPLRELLEPSALGEIFDSVCEHVCTGRGPY